MQQHQTYIHIEYMGMPAIVNEGMSMSMNNITEHKAKFCYFSCQTPTGYSKTAYTDVHKMLWRTPCNVIFEPTESIIHARERKKFIFYLLFEYLYSFHFEKFAFYSLSFQLQRQASDCTQFFPFVFRSPSGEFNFLLWNICSVLDF